MKISDLVPRRSFRASELYRAVYGPMGVEFQMAVTLPSAPGTVVGIALNRDRRDFGERDRRVLQLLQPHLAQQRRDAADREAADATAGMLELVLADRRQAAVALGRGDTVAAASARAAALMRAYLPRPQRPAALPEPLAHWLARTRAAGLAPGGPFVVEGPEGTLVGRAPDRGRPRRPRRPAVRGAPPRRRPRPGRPRRPGAERPAGGGPRPRRPGVHQRRDRRPDGHQPADRPEAPGARLRPPRRPHPRRRRREGRRRHRRRRPEPRSGWSRAKWPRRRRSGTRVEQRRMRAVSECFRSSFNEQRGHGQMNG